MAKPAQDMRFDIPTIGTLLETAINAGIQAIALESQRKAPDHGSRPFDPAGKPQRVDIVLVSEQDM